MPGNIDVSFSIAPMFDTTLVNYTLSKGFVSAVVGDWAGIIISIAIGLPSCTRDTIELWKGLVNMLNCLRDKKENPRILNGFVLTGGFY